MDNSIQATSCKASAEISFGQRSTGPATGSSFRTHGDSTPGPRWVRTGVRSWRAWKKGEPTGMQCRQALPVRDTIRCFKQTRRVQVTEPVMLFRNVPSGTFPVLGRPIRCSCRIPGSQACR